MRTKDELFREALRHIAARRQQAVTAAERDRAAALAPLILRHAKSGGHPYVHK